ncbi:hypothetical protein TSTA_010010 [Talaromyces stipitatus ATCC 10500]|uniref:Uncharacterized protein n=1 Tax=Talaromyces stipitatus (strain ATCC 10500 / CBS 375.48 / QM 6759 / NRRL 1006) TaxID=441959 RepID=B8MG16_TALSN|nr:uncharacterized protein TSTA_010010 [Talaromyces stipitatus ATCC 10500]EED15883.1 hypothetical protein TSTA_010010 [Talaromyces stipitatus ATCC 10500]
MGLQSALSRLQIMALWIARTPQQKQQWKLICQIHRLKDKFIYLAISIYYEVHDLLHEAISREGEFQDLHEDITAAASYPAPAEEQSLPSENHPVTGKSIEARVLQKLLSEREYQTLRVSAPDYTSYSLGGGHMVMNTHEWRLLQEIIYLYQLLGWTYWAYEDTH